MCKIYIIQVTVGMMENEKQGTEWKAVVLSVTSQLHELYGDQSLGTEFLGSWGAECLRPVGKNYPKYLKSKSEGEAVTAG